MKQELIQLISQKSFIFSETPSFKLASGKMSQYYVNCKPTILNPRGMNLVGHLVYEKLKIEMISAVGGLTFGADPIAVATSFVSGLKGQPVNAFSVRKQQKDHGMIRWIEGDVKAGDKVAILEDVATTGGSTIKAIERVRSEGLDVIQVVVLVDRQEGGLDNIRLHVDQVDAIVTRDELLGNKNYGKKYSQ
ncbi:orotate phosphoribosyltransferase [Candidatus Magnetomorum sp. HK-1]|nr:orotate phosphoribosyltransferase [Candidatus Magnetomorum sp. HK-1]